MKFFTVVAMLLLISPPALAATSPLAGNNARLTSIMAKKNDGTALTDEEQATLQEYQADRYIYTAINNLLTPVCGAYASDRAPLCSTLSVAQLAGAPFEDGSWRYLFSDATRKELSKKAVTIKEKWMIK
jgi:hypothetical protein